MYNKISVRKPAGISPGSAAAKDPNVTIVDVDDILFFPPRDASGVVMVGDFVMKPGAIMIQLYMTKSKISAPFTSEGDEDSVSIKQAFEGIHPGNKIEVREFIQNWLGKNVIIIHGSCSETEKEVVGTLCAPLQIKPEKVDNNDSRHFMIKFEAFAKSPFLPGLYTGALTLDAPYNVADAANLAINTAVHGNQYSLPANADNTVSVASITAADREHITLLGNGGADPTVLVGGVAGTATVILRGGTNWVALAGSAITLEVINGGATKYLVEQNRSQLGN